MPGYGDRYEASSLGRVRIADTGYVLKSRLGRGYPTLSLYWDRHHSARVHRLVAAAFHGPCPEGLEVRHLDGVRTNNVPTNLAYGTHAENIRDTVRHGTFRNAHTDKTHCIRGHAFTPENTWASPASGKRACLTCNKLRLDAKRAGIPFPKPPTPPNPKREEVAA